MYNQHIQSLSPNAQLMVQIPHKNEHDKTSKLITYFATISQYENNLHYSLSTTFPFKLTALLETKSCTSLAHGK